MSRKTRIAFPVHAYRAPVPEAPGIVSINDDNLLKMLKTVNATEQVLRSTGIHLGEVQRDDSESLHFAAIVDERADQDPLAPSKDVEKRIGNLRSSATPAAAAQGKEFPNEPAKPHGGASNAVDSGSVTDRMTSLLSHCPAFVDVEGRRVALGTPSNHRPRPIPSTPAQLSYDSIATEKHLVGRDHKHYRCPEGSSISELDTGATVQLHVSGETQERIVDIDDIDRQSGWDFDTGP